MPALQQKMKVQVKGNKEDKAGHHNQSLTTGCFNYFLILILMLIIHKKFQISLT